MVLEELPKQMKVTQVSELEAALAAAEKKLETEKAKGADSLSKELAGTAAEL